MDYKEQLNTPEWNIKRLQILQRDNYTCQRCGKSPKKCTAEIDFILNVHHLKYIPQLMAWEYNEKYLVTLCNFCHEYMHIKLKLLYNVFTELDVKYFDDYITLFKRLTEIYDPGLYNIDQFIDKINRNI